MKSRSNILDGGDRCVGMRSSPAGEMLIEHRQEQVCLLSLSSKVWQDDLYEQRGFGRVHSDHVGSSSRLERFARDRAIKHSGYKVDGLSITHAELDTDSVLSSDRSIPCLRLDDGEASFAVHQASNVGNFDRLHLNVQRLSLRGVGVERPRNARHDGNSPRGDIVWPLLKDKAVAPFMMGCDGSELAIQSEHLEHPALYRRRLCRHLAPVDLSDGEELAGDHPPVHRNRSRHDLQRRDRAVRIVPLHRADLRSEGWCARLDDV